MCLTLVCLVTVSISVLCLLMQSEAASKAAEEQVEVLQERITQLELDMWTKTEAIEAASADAQALRNDLDTLSM